MPTCFLYTFYMPLKRLLLVGCGDIARRVLPYLRGHYRVFALLRDRAQFPVWRQRGAQPIWADLDDTASLRRLAGLAERIVYLAPPPGQGQRDTRTRRFLAVLRRPKIGPKQIIYLSTSGVYGDCAGAMVSETRPPRPTNARAERRLDAETEWRRFGAQSGARVSVLRVPGIYARERLPLERLQKNLPALCAADDVFTNHIHADDLARLICATLRYGAPNRIYNASDDSALKMGDYFDLVADHFALPRAPRLAQEDAEKALSPLQFSFMRESRRLDNRRIKEELKAQLHFAHVALGLKAMY